MWAAIQLIIFGGTSSASGSTPGSVAGPTYFILGF